MDSYNVNIGSITYLTKNFYERLQKRSKRSAIINLGSSASLLGQRGMAVYSGAKGYDLRFSLSIGEHMKDKVDVLAVLPGLTKTPMVAHIYNHIPGGTTPDDVVEQSLTQLGRDVYTFGAITHKLTNSIMLMPYWTCHLLFRVMVSGVRKTAGITN
jgi:short-subunit dehydrogenase